MKLFYSYAFIRALMLALISLAFTFNLPTTALALNKAQAIKGCLDNTLSELEKNELLLDMETWTTVFSSFVEENASTCFAKLTGSPAEFVNNKGFVSGEDGLTALEAARKLVEAEKAERLKAEAAAEKARAAKIEAQAMAKEAVRLRVCEVRELIIKHDKTINEAEAARQDRRIETLSATVQECRSWFDESPREALTNDVCNPIFAAGGLPNSTIAGPSQSELLLAELSKKNAERELEVLYASGMLLEDFIAQYPSREVDDRYNCDK